MLTRTRLLSIIALAIGMVSAGSLLLSRHCPREGLAVTQKARSLHLMKNRTTMPQSEDLNPQVSLSELLRQGNDRFRWSTQHAARIEGYVVAVAYARPEATNCFVPWRRDIHINLGLRADAPLKEQVVLEVTPNLSDWAASQGWDWSETALRAELLGQWCEFEGWLFFDEGHAEDSENIAPDNPTNWRATAWEIHPITKIRRLK